ncbi:MAG: hypothetical protein P8Y24_14115 [Gammaproteobacteria bacterium]|jgi:hypothetical protein
MKKLRAYLVVLALLGITPVSYATVNTNLESETFSGESNSQETSIVLAANAGIQVGMESQLVTSGIHASNSDDAESVSIAGIVFALVLLGAGSLVGRKKKVKTNDMVGVFARIN